MDTAGEILKLCQILSGKEREIGKGLTEALEHIARIIDADRAYLCSWDPALQTIATATQWNRDSLEPMPDRVVQINDLARIDDYLKQNHGSCKIHVEPVLHLHQLIGLFCLESIEQKSRPLDRDERNFVQTACYLMAPYLAGSNPASSSEKIEMDAVMENDSSREPDENAPTVLIVEDNKINQFTMSKIWQRIGTNTAIANNGSEAIQLCNRKRFDLILMDLSMPVMDGFDTTREIVTHSEINRKTPIVAVTAVTDEGTDRRCQKVGMAEYLVKPLRLERVKELAKEYLPGLGQAS